VVVGEGMCGDEPKFKEGEVWMIFAS
jgi:hypothetical protein